MAVPSRVRESLHKLAARCTSAAGWVDAVTPITSTAGKSDYADAVTSTLTQLEIVRAGVVDYQTAWDEQRRLHAAVTADAAPDTVMLLEHPSVYTAGKRTQPWDRPQDGTPVIDVDRG